MAIAYGTGAFVGFADRALRSRPKASIAYRGARVTARWPRLLKLKAAAEYCDMTPAAFEGEVMSGRFPAPRNVGGRDHWDRKALDKAIDNLMGEVSNDYYATLKARLNAA